MYAIKQRETDGAIIIQDCVYDEVVIQTDEITRFLNELCENEMISEGSKYEELKENCLLLQAENEKLKADKEPSHVSIVMLSRFDEASEKAMSTIKWNDKERRTIVDYVRVQREALASQKISGA